MTAVPSANPTKVVKSFFDAYRKHDVERMIDLCDDMAGYRSVPVELWQSVGEPRDRFNRELI